MKAQLVAMCALLLTLAAGCSKNDNFHLDGPEAVDCVQVSPDYVPIDWESTTVQPLGDTGTYQFQFADSVPDLHPGSIIAIDMDTAVYYRIVQTVDSAGGTVRVTTSEAQLTDIFYDSEFTLSTAKVSGSKSAGAVFSPVAAYVVEADGSYRSLPLASGSKASTRFTHNLWQYEFDHDNQTLFEGDHWRIYMERMNFDLSLDLEFYMNFGGRTTLEVVGDAYERYRSRTMKVRAELVGTFSTEQRVRCDIEGSCRHAEGYDLWKHNLFRPVTVRFVAGGVPIVLTLRSDLFRDVELTASGEVNAYTGFADRAEGRMGFEWSQAGDISPLASFNHTFSLTPPTVEGRGQAQAKVWAFPRVSVMLYDEVGPSFDFMPYLADTVRGGFREQMMGQSEDYCGYDLACHAGLDLRCGLSLRFFGYEVGNYSTPRWNPVDRRLYHSPRKVVHTSGRPDVGQSATVRFNVFDHNYLTDADVLTPLPQIVKFEAGGTLSAEYGIARGGTVEVDWTPTEGDVLYARLYGPEGDVLAWDTVRASGECDCNVSTTLWVDLGLPSGLLWASHNVGASAPEGYGDYFAWGETSPKSTYTWENYRYGGYDADGNWQVTKYNTNSSYGPVDGLTTLQPSDDAATANWGGGARTPTYAEWQEMLQHTTGQWVQVNGVWGHCRTASNGNSIFLPAAGDRWDGELDDAGSDGDYWSATLDESYPGYAWYFYFDPADAGMNDDYYYRYDGHSVRPVRSAR